MNNKYPFSVLIPAAGASRRLGQPKQLIQVNGQTLLSRTVRIASTLPAREILVITGASAAQLPCKAELNETSPVPVRLISNAHWTQGLGSSIALGAKSVHPDSVGLMILLCDQWRIEASDLQSLLDIWLEDPGALIASNSGSVTGPPAIFPRVCFKSLGNLQGDTGARRVLQEFSNVLRLVNMEHAATDLDTPDDLERLQSTLKLS